MVTAKAARSRVYAAEGTLPKDALSTPYTLKAYTQNQTKGARFAGWVGGRRGAATTADSTPWCRGGRNAVACVRQGWASILGSY